MEDVGLRWQISTLRRSIFVRIFPLSVRQIDGQSEQISRLCGHFHLHDSQDLSVLVVRGGYITRHALLEKVENYYDLRLQCQDIDFVVVFQITVLSE